MVEVNNSFEDKNMNQENEEKQESEDMYDDNDTFEEALKSVTWIVRVFTLL